jgi:glycosyltransferase involved in cell wall biosynthesis
MALVQSPESHEVVQVRCLPGRAPGRPASGDHRAPLKLVVVTGLYDVQTAGNQSLKNTLIWLSEAGMSIDLFSIYPHGYPTLRDPSIFGRKVRVRRLPRWLNPLFHLAKLIKDSLGRWKPNGSADRQDVRESRGIYAEYNWFGRLTHIAFMFLVCVPIQLLRAGFFSMRFRPDLLYGLSCQGALTASLLGRLLHVPVVTRFHGVIMRPEGVSRWRHRLWHLDEIAGLLAFSQVVIVTNDGTRGDETLKRLGVPRGRVYYWMNGFDVADLRCPEGYDAARFKAEMGLEGKHVVLMLSRLAGSKRVDRGVVAVADLVHRYGRRDVVLLIAGEGGKRGELEALRRRLGVEPYVRFLGAVPHSDVYKYYTVADVFLNLYDVSNLGNPLIEAMCFGKPIVTIDDGSTAALLVHQENAILVDLRQITEDLPRWLSALLAEPSLREKLGKAARATFDEKVLTWQARMALEERLLRDVGQRSSRVE